MQTQGPSTRILLTPQPANMELKQRVNIGMSHARLSNPHQKHYWGRHSGANEEGSIREILATGGKWPDFNK